MPKGYAVGEVWRGSIPPEIHYDEVLRYRLGFGRTGTQLPVHHVSGTRLHLYGEVVLPDLEIVICGCGEMADTPDSESGARKGVEVQILSSALG